MTEESMKKIDDGGPGLMDNETLTAAFRAHKEGQTKFTRRMAITIADMAGMRPMSLVWRLEKMGLLKRGSWEWFKKNGGITKEHEREVRTAIQADAMIRARAPSQDGGNHE